MWEVKTQDKTDGQQQKRRFTLVRTHNTMVSDDPDIFLIDIWFSFPQHLCAHFWGAECANMCTHYIFLFYFLFLEVKDYLVFSFIWFSLDMSSILLTLPVASQFNFPCGHCLISWAINSPSNWVVFLYICCTALILKLSFAVIVGILFSFFSDWVSYFKDFILPLFWFIL